MTGGADEFYGFFAQRQNEGKGKMSRFLAALVILLGIGAGTVSCSDPKPLPEEEGVLDALRNVQSGFETKIPYDQFDVLIVTAKNKLETLKKIEKKNTCFYNAVNKSVASYEICKKALKLKEEAKDEKRKTDMEITLSFTLGYASVNLAKANECFKR